MREYLIRYVNGCYELINAYMLASDGDILYIYKRNPFYREKPQLKDMTEIVEIKRLIPANIKDLTSDGGYQE